MPVKPARKSVAGKQPRKPAGKQRGGAADLSSYIARNDLAYKIQRMTPLNSLPKTRRAKKEELQRTDAALRTRVIDDAMMAKAKDLCHLLQQVQKLANAFLVAPADVQATTSAEVMNAVSDFGAKVMGLAPHPPSYRIPKPAGSGAAAAGLFASGVQRTNLPALSLGTGSGAAAAAETNVPRQAPAAAAQLQAAAAAEPWEQQESPASVLQQAAAAAAAQQQRDLANSMGDELNAQSRLRRRRQPFTDRLPALSRMGSMNAPAAAAAQLLSESMELQRPNAGPLEESGGRQTLPARPAAQQQLPLLWEIAGASPESSRRSSRNGAASANEPPTSGRNLTNPELAPSRRRSLNASGSGAAAAVATNDMPLPTFPRREQQARTSTNSDNAPSRGEGAVWTQKPDGSWHVPPGFKFQPPATSLNSTRSSSTNSTRSSTTNS